MTFRTLLAACAVLAFAPPALAQDAPAQPEAPAEAPREPTPEEIALQASGEAFQADMEAMEAQLQAVMSDETTNGEQKREAVETILLAHTPGINAFADELDAFLTGQADASTNPEEQAQLRQAAEVAPGRIRAIPDQVRSAFEQALARAAAADAAAEAAVER